MKQIIFTLCVFFTMMTVANSAEIYNCVGNDGKIFFTDNPPQNAKCKYSAGEEADTSQQQQQQTADETQQTNQNDESKSQTGQAKKLIKIPRLSY
ncbi:hypothetical protein ASZ90_008104 [hydrocarbon metagenome]|uniref:DUF4124 domain-containing protein n=1 Tax=hydrocarbon metagenome TaxID=938273 RepID=A0A0W8FMI7_9ZZZZ